MEYKTNPVKAIRDKCLDCCAGQAEEVRWCPIERCALWPFRFGKNPFRKTSTRVWTEEERRVAAERMRGI